MFGGGSSGSVKVFTILLDNPTRSYFAGQVVTGRLILELDRERKTSGVKINFVGRADVRWTESHTVTTGTGSNRRTRTERRTYSDRETYCDEKLYVIGRSGGPEIQLPPGRQEFPFSFQLPLGIPSSFKGHYGHIQYNVASTLKKSWGFDKTTVAIFTVNGIVDLNTSSGGVPSLFTKQKHLGCLCCKDGPISFVFKLNRTGYVPGEGLDFLVEMNNQSTKPVPRVKIYLKQNVSFHARGKSKHETDVLTGFVGPGVGAGETEVWRPNPADVRVPAIPPTNLGGCRIIRVGYAIYVEMEIPSGFNLKGSTDVLIGTIPFRNTFAQMQRQYFPEPSSIPSGDPGSQPSAPPLLIAGYADLPPPSYQDAFSGELPTYQEACEDEGDGGGDGNATGSDKKTKETAFDPNFVPKYATYGWMTAPPRS